MDVLTVGVEEEYLLVDRGTRAPVNRGPQVIATAARELGELVQSEFFDAQVEVCTRPTTDCADLRGQLSLLRETTTRAARGAGCLLVASGVPVIAPLEPLTVTESERYQRMARRSAHFIDGFTASAAATSTSAPWTGRGPSPWRATCGPGCPCSSP